MDNDVVAAGFDELADLLELRGESPFKIRAYRTFADSVRELGEPLAAVVARGALGEMPGVGKAIADKLEELFASGSFRALERERAAVPVTLRDLLALPGIGAKGLQTLWAAGIVSLGTLVDACERGEVAGLPRFGDKKEERLHQSARKALGRPPGRVLADAAATASAIIGVLESACGATALAVGELRRATEVVREVTVLCTGTTTAAAREALFRVAVVTEERPGVLVLTLERAARARVRIVPREHWAHSVIVETGPRSHVVRLEEVAADHGGLAAVCARVASEREAYEALGRPFVTPELREADAPASGEGLVEMADLGGVFHVHTTWSDGKASMDEMIAAAKSAGLGFIGISEHSKAASYAGGLDRDKLLAQKEEIARVRDAGRGIEILHGVEVDVLADGSLDLDDEILASLDFVIASVHTDHDMPAPEMTRRILRAVGHPLVTILGHPTGRLLLAKPSFEFDLEAVARAAVENDTYLEINANAQRLDLGAPMIRAARAVGARFAINPDAHELDGFGHVPFGVATARRAGLPASEILNACDAATVRERLRARKQRALERLAALC